ncbi:MAG: translation initiation factor eIF-2B subunit alpha [Geoglossum umbratile]|nr:MAG: translation initiation factor eIF-2B subunit alpha [Geoglossum umbratile]
MAAVGGPHGQTACPFDIVATYRRLLADDPDLTMPVAAIEALVELLAQSQASTISETLNLLETSTQHLKSHIPNPISLSAGTDVFQRYIIHQLQRPSGGTHVGADFQSIRNHLLSNGRLFVSRAKQAREQIAAFGKGFVRDGTTVLTNGRSRVVGALLQRAAETGGGGGSVRFRVIYVLGGSTNTEGDVVVGALREKGVPVAVIGEGAVGYAMGKVDMVIVGAEGVVENGGVISRLGTYQIGLLARAAGKPFYVVAESHKFVRLYPLSQYDLPIEQKVIDFRTATGEEEAATEAKDADMATAERTPRASENAQHFGNATRGKTEVNGAGNPVDFTPPDLISALVTEHGVLTPSAVSEQLIKIWF